METSSADVKYADATFERVLSFPGKSIVPGFVDSHTHPVWAGDRVEEFKMKLSGATYMDIHKMGGGIGYTVRHTQEASEDSLVDSFILRLHRMLRAGTTLVEAKSGYGLEKDTEIKMLRVIQRAVDAPSQPIDIVANYCGAHSVPKGLTADEATHDVIHNQLPAIVALKESGVINPEQIDVFCETGVFTTEQTKQILEAGAKAGLSCNFHGDELSFTGSCELAGELQCAAVAHVEHASEEGIQALAKNEVVAVLLPTTAYVLRIAPPRARDFIAAGVPVALASDFNPNAHCLSMPFVMNLACVTMKMTLNEALVASTLNSAHALRRSDLHGSIEEGKFANFVVIDAPKWEHVVYQMCDPPIQTVIIKGSIVHNTQA